MAKIIVIQHVAYEILGTMHALFKRQGMRMKYINFSRDPLRQVSVAGYDGMVILGGPMNADQVEIYPHLDTEIAMIQEAMTLNMPILGICLGAQLIAKANGAKVTKNNVKEIGWYDISPTEHGYHDPFIKHFKASEKIFQWHGDTFAMPKDAVLLATGQSCQNQAFRLRNNIYGFQFHLEVDEPIIERWLTVPSHVAEINKLKGQVHPQQIREETKNYIKQSKQLSHHVFNEFSKLVGHREKSPHFPSR